MKKLISFTIALFAIGYAASAQCGSKVSWNAPKADIVDKDGKLVTTLPGKVLVETSQTSILMRHDEEGRDDLKGSVSELKCDWKEPYKNGRITFRTTLEDASGDLKPASVTIEAVNGKITITVTPDQIEKGKIRIEVDSYKENM
jgi:hypothetical protein